MTATTYTDQQNYIKYNLDNKSKEDCGCGGSCGECSHKEEKCGCCPVGMVGVYDDKGQFISCMTPNDAELYKKNTMSCQDGYVMLINNTTGEKLGCVPSDEYADLNNDINGTGTPIPPTGLGVGGGTQGGGVILSGTSGTTGLPLVPVFTPLNTTNQSVVWSSTDPTVATVDSTGMVTPVANGTVTIKVTSVVDSSIHGSKTFTVADGLIAPTAIQIVGGNTVDMDATLPLFARFTPLNTSDQRVTWSSSDASVAAVDSSGVVSGFLEGHTTITAISFAGTIHGTLVVFVTNNS